jgi:SPP1 family predicted phage head-tail adaptor
MLTQLRDRVVLQSRSLTTIGGGCYTASWSTVSTLWSKVNWDAANESFQNDKEQDFKYGYVYTRHGITINKNNRFLFGGQVLHIESVVDATNRNNLTRIKVKCEVV